MDEIADFYGDESKNQTTIVNKMVNGTFCAALFAEDDQWYRAAVTKTYSPHQVEVQYIGNKTTSGTGPRSLGPIPRTKLKCSTEVKR